MVKPKPGEIWLLATSAVHMPRAMAIAKKQGWPMLPWPTDYFTAPELQGRLAGIAADNLGLADYAVHEWIGIIAYRLTGKALVSPWPARGSASAEPLNDLTTLSSASTVVQFLPCFLCHQSAFRFRTEPAQPLPISVVSRKVQQTGRAI